MRIRDLRFLTVVVIAAACGWTVIQGVALVSYRVSQFSAAGGQRTEALDTWTDRLGLASLALEDLLRAQANPADRNELRQRQALLARLLAVRPAASQSWIALASVQNSLAMPSGAIAGSFQMSALTGPNEGEAMFQRSLLGVLLWERIPAGVRARATTDLCGLTVFDPVRFRILLTVKSEEVRADIRENLTSSGCPPRIVELIGL